MNIKYTVTLASLFFCFQLFSQNELLVGITGGATVSKIRGFNSPRELSSGIGFNVGVSVAYTINKNSSIVTNLLYDRKSIKDEAAIAVPGVGFVNTERKTNYNFFSFPLLYRHTFNIKKFQPYINAGPYLALLDNVTRNDFELFEGEFKKMEYGITLGLGTNYKLSDTYYVSFEVRNNLGLSKINAIPVDFEGGEVKTNSINIMLGFSKNFDL